ncbi:MULTISPECIES: hypothetical protein [unclassified Thioalkalivibrio]|uniref:hypothetical protein n=1 Tax=unclassified Thioalkalivibrio TaxID=2621013 RepID=UPI00035E56F9|nr:MULTISPECIES: hypothetical protein [unclassified Thioalkalivibrio]
MVDWETVFIKERYGIEPQPGDSILILSDLSEKQFYHQVIERTAEPPEETPSKLMLGTIVPGARLAEVFADRIRAAGLIVVDILHTESLSRATARNIEELSGNSSELILATPALSSVSTEFDWVDSEDFCGWIAAEGLIRQLFASVTLRKIRGSRWQGDVATFYAGNRRPTVNLICGVKGTGKTTRYDIELRSGAIGVRVDSLLNKLDKNLNKNFFSQEFISHIKTFKTIQEREGRSPRLLQSQMSFAKYILATEVLEEFFDLLAKPVLDADFNYVFEGGILTNAELRKGFRRHLETEKNCLVWVSLRETG